MDKIEEPISDVILYKSTGISMDPTLLPGDILQVEEIKTKEIITPVQTNLYMGKSMNPLFTDNDLIDIGIYHNPEEIKIGDIVVTKELKKTGDKRVCHRIVEITPEGKIKTKGDNNSGIDFWDLTIDDLEGKVINADRPHRVKKYLIHNQYSKQSRELVEKIIQEEKTQREELQKEINFINEKLKETSEYKALYESKEWSDYLSDMATSGEISEKYDDGLITEEEYSKAKEEWNEVNARMLESKIYTDYFNLSLHADLKETQNASTEFELNTTRIERDCPEVRKNHEIQGFPVMMLEIPKYLDFNRNVIPESKKYLQKIRGMKEIEAFQGKHIDNIKNIIGREKVILT